MIDILARQEMIRLREGQAYFNRLVVNNGKKVEVYNTGRGNETNYERFEVFAESNVFVLRAAKGGTGLRRDVQIDPGSLLVVTSAVSLGPAPAQTGQLRLPNNTSVYARNAAGTGDIQLVGSNTNNDVVVAAGGQPTRVGGPLVVGSGTPQATTGDIRLGNLRAVTGRNAANTGDIVLVFVDASDRVVVGGATVTVGNRLDLAGKELLLPLGGSW